MRISLVNMSKKTEVRLPQGLLYLASAAHAAGHKVIIHDETLSTNSKSFLEKIFDSNADVIGFSVYSVPWQLKRVEELSQILKASRKTATVIWGGWHPTLYPRQSILNENVDIVIRGPAERTLCRTLTALEHQQSLSDIPGLTFKRNGEIIGTPSEELSIEYLFPPINFGLIDMDAYIKRNDMGSGILPYITSRGCYGRCRFCVMSNLFCGSIFRKPRHQIVNELKWLFKNHTITTIHFSDDNAFRNNEEAQELCNIVNSVTNGRKVLWRCATRIDTISRLSNDAYKTLVSSGCKGFSVGIESGVDRVLELMRKDITFSQIQKAMRNMLSYKLHSNLFFFLFNFIGETTKEAKRSLQLACKTRLLFPYSDIAIYTYFHLMSDSTWLPANLPPSQASRLSDIFQCRAKETVNYRVAGIDMKILQHYFSVSKRSEEVPTHEITGLIRNLYKNMAFFRIKHCFFVFPIEYFLLHLSRKIMRALKGRSN